MIPKPRKVRRLRRVRRLYMHTKFTLLPAVWNPTTLAAMEADPAVQAWFARVQEAKAAERAAFEDRKRARRTHAP